MTSPIHWTIHARHQGCVARTGAAPRAGRGHRDRQGLRADAGHRAMRATRDGDLGGTTHRAIPTKSRWPALAKTSRKDTLRSTRRARAIQTNGAGRPQARAGRAQFPALAGRRAAVWMVIAAPMGRMMRRMTSPVPLGMAGRPPVRGVTRVIWADLMTVTRTPQAIPICLPCRVAGRWRARRVTPSRSRARGRQVVAHGRRASARAAHG